MPFSTSDYFNFKISLNVVLFLLIMNMNVREILNLEIFNSEGICPQELGYTVNKFLDQCFRGHHFFQSMRAYNLKNLYTIQCCPGYQEILWRGSELRCSPICSTACKDGTCIKPETCQCNSGYYLRKQYECAPICSPSCINGDCVGFNLCSCKIGYRKLNSSKHECEPICEPRCENGQCILPGVCKCNKGYEVKTEYSRKCEPRCTGGCKNGICSQPDTCECLAGYEKINKTECEPICHSGCGVGICVQPDECSCFYGYHAIKGDTCKPICKGCVEGTCVSPDICHCPSGRTLNTETNECEFICSPPCINGICTISGNCSCYEGYRINKKKQCEPICQPPCKSGHCIGPNQCECYSGYKLKPFSDNECEPICSSPCPNGTCIAPEICQCSPGFVEIDKNVCDPICLNGCEPGICISPNVCECPEGYDAGEEGSCKPICSPPCDRGICIAPDICICSDGYAWDDLSNRCVSSCKETCENGICISPNTCECHEGYEKLSDTYCYPTCSRNCSNGICTAPDICTCLPGFNNNPHDSYDCLPELGAFKDYEGPSLNVYTLPSSIRFLEDTKTFFFTKLPKFIFKKECYAASDIVLTNTTSESIYIQINCSILKSVSEIELYCSWLPQEVDPMSLFWNDSLIENSAIVEQSGYLDFRFYLLFPEALSDVEEGNCSVSLEPIIQPKYFSLTRIENLVLKIWNEELGISIEKGQFYESASINLVYGITALIGSIALILPPSIFWLYRHTKEKRKVEPDLKLESMEKEDFIRKPKISNDSSTSQTFSNCENTLIVQASEL